MSECATCGVELEPKYYVVGICVDCMGQYCPLCLEWWDDCLDTVEELAGFLLTALPTGAENA